MIKCQVALAIDFEEKSQKYFKINFFFPSLGVQIKIFRGTWKIISYLFPHKINKYQITITTDFKEKTKKIF